MPAPLYPRAYQANALVRAPLKLTHVEARIFALALGCIHQGQTELLGIIMQLVAGAARAAGTLRGPEPCHRDGHPRGATGIGHLRRAG
ncbi:replication initiation protein [Hymenobacter amundsenii]|uniref:replication initiation protein n=1 Tax=Hymenobacter amundsenii TaxID=2006685 RepID=UPI0013FDD81A|nr:replication initiation protein [Hymenobacter amundsenii]